MKHHSHVVDFSNLNFKAIDTEFLLMKPMNRKRLLLLLKEMMQLKLDQWTRDMWLKVKWMGSLLHLEEKNF